MSSIDINNNKFTKFRQLPLTNPIVLCYNWGVRKNLTKEVRMPRMQETVPIPKSTFIMTEACECGSVKFKSKGGSNIECLKCGKPFDDFEQLFNPINSWRYDPIPPQATNI